MISEPVKIQLLQRAPLLLFVMAVTIFGALSPRFLAPENFVNILIQASATAIVTVGITFTLLIAGIDLSVGTIMFVAAAIAGKLVLGGQPLWLACLVLVLTGFVYGAVNATIIAYLRVIPFIATLATLYFGRGFGLWITETRAMNLPEQMLRIGSARIFGVPFPVLILALVIASAQVALTQTSFGRQIYALGNDPEAARKAGINVTRLKFTVYVISGFCAALGGLVSVAQLGAVSPTFGNNREFAAIAAAALGGVSLFGGKGNIFPGALLGALFIQTLENGLVIVNADPYLYPLVMSAIIFLAVWLDTARHRQWQRLRQRRIRPVTQVE